MNIGIEKATSKAMHDQRGITGLETAIVLIAFVVVASVFAFAVITIGLFSSDEAKTSARAGVETAKSTLALKGSMVVEEATSQGTDSLSVNAAFLSDAANGDFFDEGVAIGDLVTNVTDGSTCTAAVVTATTVTCASPLAGGVENDWDAGETYRIDMDQISTVKFKVGVSPGAKPFSLASNNTVISFIDESNNQNGAYLAAIPFGGGGDPFAAANTVYWTHNWIVGSGPGINGGDLVEFTLNLKNLAAPLIANSTFSVEIVPQTGGALKISRTTPLDMAHVMNLR